jgi:hypothetical protein
LDNIKTDLTEKGEMRGMDPAGSRHGSTEGFYKHGNEASVPQKRRLLLTEGLRNCTWTPWSYCGYPVTCLAVYNDTGKREVTEQDLYKSYIRMLLHLLD